VYFDPKKVESVKGSVMYGKVGMMGVEQQDARRGWPYSLEKRSAEMEGTKR